MEIRTAGESDLVPLVNLDHIARSGQEGRKEFIAEVIEKGECYVALIKEKIVGYVVLNYTFYGNGHIDMLYLEKKFRGQGIGASLIDHVEGLCEKEKLFTSTNLSNLRMQKLLGKKRFVISGIIHNLDDGDPEIIYFKRIRRENKSVVTTPPSLRTTLHASSTRYAKKEKG